MLSSFGKSVRIPEACPVPFIILAGVTSPRCKYSVLTAVTVGE